MAEYVDNIVDLERIETDAKEIANLPENSETKPNIIMKSAFSQSDATYIIKNLPSDQLIICFTIYEEFMPFDEQNFDKIKEVLHDKQVIAFQSESEAKFSLIWRKSKNEVYAVNIFPSNIKKEDLTKLCTYILEFLNGCLNQNHSGLSNDNNFQNERKFSIDITSLANTNNFNLLFNAASNGHTNIIPILLDLAFNVNMMHGPHVAVSFAYAYEHLDSVIEFLKRDSIFPPGITIDNCFSKDFKDFAQKSQKLNDHIKASNLEEIRNILTQNQNLRTFYNIDNQSASAVALINKKFDVYELLLQSNMRLSRWEDMEDISENLIDEEKTEIREIHFRNKKDLDNHHLNLLMSKCSVGHDDEQVKRRLNHVMKAFQTINEFPMIKILLKIAALLSNLEIVFDFNHEAINYLDPKQNRNNAGMFYFNGRIYVGAKQLLDPTAEHEVFATIAHELCHCVLYALFENEAKPYNDNDKETEAKFEAISVECRKNKKIDEIISTVYKHYEEYQFHAELIVRIPHFYAHYFNQPERITELKNEFKSLFNFYEVDLIAKLEQGLTELKMKNLRLKEEVEELKTKVPKMKEEIDLLETKQKEKDRKILFLIIFLVFGAISMVFFIKWIYEPTYKWLELDNEQKIKVFNGNVEFEGIEMKFNEVYGQNESNNGVFEKLTSEQIKILLNNETLNLNQAQNRFLQDEIYLIYNNLTEKLKEKIKNSEIEFQGQPVIISSLLNTNNGKNYLQTLNSTEILALAKNKSSSRVGQSLVNDNNFYIKRRFNDKSVGYFPFRTPYNDGHVKYNILPLTTLLSKFKEKQIIESASYLFNKSLVDKIILLSDDAGNGKTTTFKKFTLEIKRYYPLKWVQYVDLKSKIKIYEKYQKTVGLSDIIEVLGEILEVNDLKIFKMLYDDQKLVILWDGFDEIYPNYSDILLKIMKNIKANTQNIQFISTRPHFELDFRNNFNCTAFKFFPFSKEDNKNFITSFFSQRNLTELQRALALKKIHKLIENIEQRDFVESPLMLQMITEVSLNEDELFEGTNLYTIYESFINIKFKIVNYKGNLIQDDKNKILEQGINLREIFQRYAIQRYNGYDKTSLWQKYTNIKFNTDLLSRFGILTFDVDGNNDFAHRTFHEFFYAQYIVDNIYKSNGESNCDELRQRFFWFNDNFVSVKNYWKTKEFLVGYVKTKKSSNVDQILVNCFKTDSSLNNFFYNSVKELDYDKMLQNVKELLRLYPFTSESLEILWHIDNEPTFLSWLSIKYPVEYVRDLNIFIYIVNKYFPNEPRKREKILFDVTQRGNFFYNMFKITKRNFEGIQNLESFLTYFNISANFDVDEFRKIDLLMDFFKFLQSYLPNHEIRKFYEINFVNILKEGGVEMWNDIAARFTKEEIQEIIYKGNKDPILFYIRDFSVIKLLLKTLEGTPDARFMSAVLNDEKLLFEQKAFMADDNFETVWSLIEEQTTKIERIKILNSKLLNDAEFNIFSASIEFGTLEKFKTVKDIYEKVFNSTEEMRQFCKNYIESERPKTNFIDRRYPKSDTIQEFISYFKSIFNLNEIKLTFDKKIFALYNHYKMKENLNVSHQFYRLLKENTTTEEFERKIKNLSG